MEKNEALGSVAEATEKWREQEREHAMKAFESLDGIIARTNDATLEMSGASLKALLLLNGGATIAMLGFLGAVASGQDDWAGLAEAIYGALISFSVGAGLAVLATSIAYLVSYAQVSQLTTLERQWEHPYIVETPETETKRQISNLLHFWAVAAASLSLVAFGYGVGQVATGMDTAIKNSPPPTNLEARKPTTE